MARNYWQNMAWKDKFVFFGSAEISRLILAALIKQNIKPVLVVSTLAKPAGRGLKVLPNPVTQLATQERLPILLVKSFKTGISDELINCKAKFGLLAAFGKIIPQELLNLFPEGIINVHPSLLPEFRGPSPIQYTLMSGADKAGVTIIKLDIEIDHGPIIAQQDVNITDTDDAETLTVKLADLAVNLLTDVVPRYLDKTLVPQEQQHNNATHTKLIKKIDGRANFLKTATELRNLARALTPWPGLWTEWSNLRLKLIQVESVSLETEEALGHVININNQVIIGCQNKTGLVLKQLQLAGGKIQNIDNFIRGHKNFIGSSLS